VQSWTKKGRERNGSRRGKEDGHGRLRGERPQR